MFTSRVQRDYSRSEEYMFKVYIENKLSNKYLQQSTMIWRVFTPLLWSNVKFRTIRHFNIGMTANITIFSTCPKIYHNSPQIFVTKKNGFLFHSRAGDPSTRTRCEDLHPIDFGWHRELQSQGARVFPVFRMPNLVTVSRFQPGPTKTWPFLVCVSGKIQMGNDGQYHVVRYSIWFVQIPIPDFKKMSSMM